VHNIDGAINHLKMHQKYPATKADLVEECDNLSDFSESDKKWFRKNLPKGLYNSADETITALGFGQKSQFASM